MRAGWSGRAPGGWTAGWTGLGRGRGCRRPVWGNVVVSDTGAVVISEMPRVVSHLVSDNKSFPVWVPCQGERVTQVLDFIDAVLGADIPELDHTVVGYAA